MYFGNSRRILDSIIELKVLPLPQIIANDSSWLLDSIFRSMALAKWRAM